MSQLSRNLEIDTGLLGTRADIEALLRHDRTARLAQGWRADLVGEASPAGSSTARRPWPSTGAASCASRPVRANRWPEPADAATQGHPPVDRSRAANHRRPTQTAGSRGSYRPEA